MIKLRILLLTFCFVFLATFSYSQPFSIHSGTLSSGGGRVTAGPYILSHTIGEGTAGRTVNGTYTNSTGFWSVGPKLAGSLSSTGTFVVTTELDSAAGSLRRAIDSANIIPGLNVI